MAQMITCNISNSAFEEGNRKRKSHQTERKAKREHNPRVFNIFALLPAMIMKYMYDSASYALIGWVSSK